MRVHQCQRSAHLTEAVSRPIRVDGLYRQLILAGYWDVRLDRPEAQRCVLTRWLSLPVAYSSPLLGCCHDQGPLSLEMISKDPRYNVRTLRSITSHRPHEMPLIVPLGPSMWILTLYASQGCWF